MSSLHDIQCIGSYQSPRLAGRKGKENVLRGVREEIPKNLLKIAVKFLYLSDMMYNVLGAADLYDWQREKGGEHAAGGSRDNPKKMLEISFIFLCLAYMLYNVLGTVDLHDWGAGKESVLQGFVMR